MKVIIIGGCGFLGLHIANKLISNNIETVLVDSKERYEMPFQSKKITFVNIKFPYTDIKKIETITHNKDVVIHLGWSGVPNDDPNCYTKDIEENILNSARIFHTIVKNKGSKIIFASSGGAVYGNSIEAPISENQETYPISSYGTSKLAAEKYLNFFTANSATENVIFRIGNAYGPHLSETKNPTGLIPALFKAIENDLTIDIWGDGKIIRDFIYIKDIADAFYFAVMKQNIRGIFNIGTCKGTSLVNLISLIESLFNKKLNVNWLNKRFCDVKCTILNSSKFNKVSGWKPQYDLEKGIQDMLQSKQI